MQRGKRTEPREKTSAVGEVERALRREIRRRQRAERTLRRQVDAMQRVRQLLRGEPRWPQFIRALLRAITREENVLWATFWSASPAVSGGIRSAVAFYDDEIAEDVEGFACAHPRAMRALARLYEDLLQQHRCAIILPANDARVPGVVRTFYRRRGVASTLEVPLFDDDDRLLGWISCLSADAHPDAGTVGFVEALAEKAMLAFNLSAGAEAMRALSLERSRQAHERELAEIHRRLHAGAMSPDQRVDSVLAAVLRNAGGLLGARWGLLCRRGAGNAFVPCATLRDDAVELCPATRSPWSEDDFPGPFRAVLARWASGSSSQRTPVRGAARAFVRTFSGLSERETTGLSLRCVPLIFAGDTTGLLVFLDDGKKDGVSAETALAIEALAIQAALVLGWDAVARLERTAALAAERMRLARDLHDFLAQTFGGISLQLAAVASEYPELPERLQQRLARVSAEAARGGEQLRRTLELLRPAPLERGTMADALGALARRLGEHHGSSIRCACPGGDLGLSPDQEFHLYAIAAEALNNATKHAPGRPVRLTLEVDRNAWVLRIVNAADDGPRNPADRGGLGLLHIRERAQRIGARVSFRRPAGKVALQVTLPKDV